MTRGRAAVVATEDLGRRPEIEDALTNHFHVGWGYLSAVPTNRFDIEASLHNQARFEAIDETTVETYKESVDRGDHFPAVIAYRQRKGGKLVIIDGNHRLVSHDRAGAPLDVYEVDQGTRGQTIAVMTFSFNTKHGRPTSEAERVSQALYLIDNGSSQEAAAAEVSVPMRVLKRAVAKANADRRADEVGVDRRQWDALGQSSKSRLLNITTDEGFKDAVHLAYAARLGVDEIFELVSLLNGSKSATRQRAIVRQHTEQYSDRIQAAAGGVLGTGDRKALGPKQRVNMALGQLLALPDDNNAIIKAYAAAEKKEAAKSLRTASERLAKLATALEK